MQAKVISLEFIVSSVLTIISCLLLFLVCLVWKFCSEEVYTKHTENYYKNLPEFPFFCDDLSLGPDEDYITFDVRKNRFETSLYRSRYVCSFHNLTEALEKFVERKSRLRLALGLQGQRYLQCGNERLKEPSGHLSASFRRISRHQKIKGRGLDLLIHWDKHPSSAFISEELTYHNGQIKVPEKRFYFIYASILINVSKAISQIRNNADVLCRFRLRICVSNTNYERTALHKTLNFNNSDTSSASTLSVGGHIKLEKGDSVYVRVSEANRIIHETVGNTFGIIPLK